MVCDNLSLMMKYLSLHNKLIIKLYKYLDLLLYLLQYFEVNRI